jgi:hypothetical protein
VQQFPYLRLAMLAGFLMSVSGCGNLLGSEEPKILLKEAKAQPVSPEIKHLPKKPICLDPGKKDYSVQELESALACQEEYAQVVRGKYYSMKTAIEAREKP